MAGNLTLNYGSTRSSYQLHNAIRNLVNAGSSNPTPRLIIKTGADAVLVTINLLADALSIYQQNLSFPCQLQIAGSPSAVATGTGTAAKFDIVDRDANVVVSGDVGTSGCVINLNDTAINTGDTVQIYADSVRFQVA